MRPIELSVKNEAEATNCAQFDSAIKKDLGESITPSPIKQKQSIDPMNNFDYDELDEDDYENIVPEADAVDARGSSINQQSVAYLLINAEVLLPQGEAQQMAKVVRRSIDRDGNIISDLYKTPSLHSLVYDVEFPDGTVKQYAANVLAENLLSQVDTNGHHSQDLDKILVHENMGNALSSKDAYITTKRGLRKLRQTKIGWKFLCEFKDGSNTWVSLKVFKESRPIEVAEYVTALNLETEPAFSWWVPYTLKKRDRIIASINNRVIKSNHKLGIKIPRNTKEALNLDQENGNTL